MCKGCQHEEACKSLKLDNLMPQPTPCFEPAGHASKFDALRNAKSAPAVLRFASKPESASTA